MRRTQRATRQRPRPSFRAISPTVPTSVVERSNLIKQRLTRSVPSAPHQTFRRRDVRTSVCPFDRRFRRRFLIIFAQDRGFPDRRFEAAELPFDGFPEVFQQVEAIGNLSCLRCALARGIRIKTGAVATDHLYFRMRPEPVRRGRGRAIRQQIDDLTTLQI